MSNKWLGRLQKLEGAVVGQYDVFSNGVRSPSPSVNFIFGNTQLLPFGYTAIFWGPPKGGKSILCNAIVGQLHKDYPNAIAIKFNTEMREEGQMNERVAKEFGIDLERYQGINTNRPENIFDVIERDIAKDCEEGAPIKLIIIDSITDVAGRRALNADSVNVQQMGDEAATIQAGLKRIRETLRKYKIALILTAHERAEFDQIEQMRGKKTKMAGAYYLKHFAEYFVYIAPNESKEGRMSMAKEEFIDPALKDMMGNEEKIAHKIKVQMKDSSVGVKGRVGEFTLHYFNGVINIHEEVLRLGLARGIIEKPNNVMYGVPNYPNRGETMEWRGVDAILTELAKNEQLQQEILRRIRQQDIEAFKSGKIENEAKGEVLDD